MQDIDPYFGEFWHPISNSILSENNHAGRSWSPSPQSTIQMSPVRRPIHSSTLSPCSEAGQRPQIPNTAPPFTLNTILPTTSSQNHNRSPAYLHVPNFPLPRLYQNSPNLERVDEDSLVSYSRDTVLPPLQAANVSTSFSKGVTPVSRPVSRLSWGSGGSSASTFPSWPSQNQEGFIDLTADSSPQIMGPSSRKRPTSVSRNSSASSRSSTNQKKRMKMWDNHTNDELEFEPEDEPKEVNQVDLRDVEDDGDNSLAKVLEQQRLASIKAQQEQADKPVTFSTIQCIICMESMTNVTVTHCGKYSESSDVH